MKIDDTNTVLLHLDNRRVNLDDTQDPTRARAIAARLLQIQQEITTLHKERHQLQAELVALLPRRAK